MSAEWRYFMVYGLVDPRTEEVRYIGSTEAGMSRPAYHWQSRRNHDNPALRRWLCALDKQGLRPGVVELQRCGSRAEVMRSGMLKKVATYPLPSGQSVC